jgi:hypothetical protein
VKEIKEEWKDKKEIDCNNSEEKRLILKVI